MRVTALRLALVTTAIGIGLTVLAFAFDLEQLEWLAWPGAMVERVVNRPDPGTLKKDPNMSEVIVGNVVVLSVAFVCIAKAIGRVRQARQVEADHRAAL